MKTSIKIERKKEACLKALKAFYNIKEEDIEVLDASLNLVDAKLKEGKKFPGNPLMIKGNKESGYTFDCFPFTKENAKELAKKVGGKALRLNECLYGRIVPQDSYKVRLYVG